MFDIVKIGEQEVPMLAMASVDVFYRNIFHEDPILAQTRDQDEGSAILFYEQMGFVMAKFAELKKSSEMRKLNEDAYVDWLCQFSRSDYISALPDIMNVYNGQQATESDAKKKDEEPSAE